MYIGSTSFNNLTLQAKAPTASVTGTAGVPLSSFDYQGSTIVSDANYQNPLSGVSASDSFNVAVTKGGTTSNVAIDLLPGSGRAVDRQHRQLRQSATKSGRLLLDVLGQHHKRIGQRYSGATYGISITSAPGEKLSLSSAQATPPRSRSLPAPAARTRALLHRAARRPLPRPTIRAR